MFALRSIARSAPRAAQFALRTQNRQPLLSRTTSWASTLRASSFPVVPRTMVAAFSSSSSIRSETAELIIKLDQELKMEQDMTSGASSSKDSEFQNSLKYFTSKGWAIEDAQGANEVALVKEQDGQTLRVLFNVTDINNADEDPYAQDYPEDQLDEASVEAEAGEAGSSQSAARAGREDGELDGEMIPQPPIGLTLTITSATKAGALQIDAIASNGEIILEEVGFFPDASLLSTKSADADRARSEVYAGPMYSHLDPELQALWEKYVSEYWGVNEEVAQFVVDYAYEKDTKEYMAWLENTKEFLG